MVNELIIRSVKLEEAEKLLRIYTPYITDTAITFEYDIPSLDEMKRRITKTCIRYWCWSYV